jgi:multifunctional beta-oxidation protein
LRRILEVLDKGKAASVTYIVHTKDKTSGNLIFENQGTVFLRGCGGIGGKKKGDGKQAFIINFAV